MNALIIDKEELYRLSLKEVISVASTFNEIYEAADEHEFLSHAAKRTDLSLIIMHPESLGEDCADCRQLIKRLYPDATVLVITRNKQLTKNWHASLAKDPIIDRAAPVSDVVRGIRSALKLPLDGFGAVSARPASPKIETFVSDTLSHHYEAAVEEPADLTRLSLRQKQILAMVADGLPNKEIAARLNIAEGTVKAHMHAIFKVLGVSNRTQAVIKYRTARRNGSAFDDSINSGSDISDRTSTSASRVWEAAPAY